MRELDRRPSPDTLPEHAPVGGSRAPRRPRSVGIVGLGRLGRALASALRAAGHEVDGPVGRDAVPAGEAIVLCVPDAAIEAAATAVAGSEAAFVGHTSGATPLSALAPAVRAGAAAFGLHPLQTFSGAPAAFAGSGCAIGGSTPEALTMARALALDLGTEPFPIADEDRAAYHAAASVASNFLVTLEDAAEALAGGAGLEPAAARRLLAPLVHTTVESWAAAGPERALTGPVARGDARTVAAQRDAVSEVDPDLVPMFDALVERTEALARRCRRAPAAIGAPA
jgi:predicted short-subunit dehydrogenase-like oxidoreductase (DUF2520 family)